MGIPILENPINKTLLGIKGKPLRKNITPVTLDTSTGITEDMWAINPEASEDQV